MHYLHISLELPFNLSMVMGQIRRPCHGPQHTQQKMYFDILFAFEMCQDNRCSVVFYTEFLHSPMAPKP